MGLSDLARVAPEVQATLVRLQDVVHQREMILSETSLDAMEKTEKVCIIQQQTTTVCIVIELLEWELKKIYFRSNPWTWMVVL